MKAKKLILDDKAVYLRLSAAKLAEYANAIGSGGNTLFAVMDALDDLQKQAALFSAALTYKGNTNEITEGFDLIDMLADAKYGPLGVKQLIVELAEEAGVMNKVDAAKVVAAIKAGSDKLYDAAVAVLSGDMSGLPAMEQKAEEPEENPT
jgi:hypothetical protein